jgi:3-oxoacyl-[acyl-carrier-protein] synthase III
MTATRDALTAHLLTRLAAVRRALGLEEVELLADDRFGELLDSMGLVEFVAAIADDCGTTPEAIDAAVGHRFGTVAELATALDTAELALHERRRATASVVPAGRAWLSGVTAILPYAVQPADEINTLLGRPPGWLQQHAGIHSRRLWAGQDPLDAAADAARRALQRAGLLLEDVGALLVTSEAPPLLLGLAAALHHRIGLRPQSATLEVGGACTGFLAAVWLGRQLLPKVGSVLLLTVEAPSRHLRTGPGAAGENAALFGDAAAACVLTVEPSGCDAVSVGEVLLGADGGGGSLLRVGPSAACGVELHMDGTALAIRAVRAMAEAVEEVTQRDGLAVADLRAVVAHGGNGRMPGLLARRLGLPEERVWSETPRVGNLGSASLPVAWAARDEVAGPVAWVAVGAGRTWGAALTDHPERVVPPQRLG